MVDPSKTGVFQKLFIESKDRILKFIFFGNYFYGTCIIALSIEASLQQRKGLNDPIYYLLVFSLTTIYYTIPYIRKKVSNTANKRVQWYNQHQKMLMSSQLILSLSVICMSAIWLNKYWNGIGSLSLHSYFLLSIFPLAGIFYYGSRSKALKKFSLRSIGWLKPFVIGFVWAGLATVYPVIFYGIETNSAYIPTTVGAFLFLKNFMFVSMLGIIFDIKDFEDDQLRQLQTIVVMTGLKKTLFLIVIPFSILGLGTFIYYALTHSFHLGKILFNTIPFLLLILTSFSLKKNRSILYYFIIIDGLMMIKAICGIIAITYF